MGSTKKLKLAPFIPGDINIAKGSVTTIFGDIQVTWKKSNTNVEFEIEIPGNVETEFTYKKISKNLHSGLNKILVK